MYKLILILFITALMFGCSKEDAGEMMDKAGDVAGDAAGEMMDKAGDAAGEMMDKAGDVAGDAADSAKAMVSGDAKGPKLEPLPDWDSLPPIEEEGAVAAAGEAAAGEAAETTLVEKAKEHAGDAVEKAKEHAGEAAGNLLKKE